VQEAGVAATVKHFVANDSETERRSYDALVAESVLRELYLPPFEACVAEANVALVMAAYNSVNGAFMTANRTLLHDLLKTEWGFRGVVVSDWSAAYTTVPSAQAGLDLVMPGPHGPWGDQLVAEVKAGKVAESDIDDKVARLIGLAQRVGALNGSIDGNPPHYAGSRALVDPALMRQVTSRSFVLLTNPRELLPIRSGSVERIALIGPNAVEPQTQGGGSVRVLPIAGTELAVALGEALDTYVSVHQGCITSATIAVPADGSLHDPVGSRGGSHRRRRGRERCSLPKQRHHLVGRPSRGRAHAGLRGGDAGSVPRSCRWSTRAGSRRRRAAASSRRRYPDRGSQDRPSPRLCAGAIAAT